MDIIVKTINRLPRSWLGAISRLRWRFPWLKAWWKRLTNVMRNRDVTIARGVGAGLRFNTGDSAVSFVMGTHDPLTQLALKLLLKPGMTFYDVGANVGFFSIIAARLTAPGGRVVAFEPLAENARAIVHNAQLNDFTHLEVRQVALGGADGEASFSLSAEPTWGKLTSVGKKPDQYTGDTVVPVRRLDGLIEQAGLPAPDVMKIDVEGAELEMLAGAERTLRERRPVLLIELHGTNREVAGVLESLGYVAAVLGAPDDIATAHWNANIIAAPAERADLAATIAALRSPVAAALAA